MKKKLSLFLALSLVLSLAACGKKEPEAEKLYTAGTYTESAQGYGGPVTVEITVDESKITAVKVTGDGETPSVGGAHLEELADLIKEKGDAIDAIAGTVAATKGRQRLLVEARLAAYGQGGQLAVRAGGHRAPAVNDDGVGFVLRRIGDLDPLGVENISP